MFGTDCTEHLHLSVAAMQLGKGLHEQMQDFLNMHPTTTLIIIDTLQKVREACGDCSYGSDYETITSLKRFADAHGICLLLVHHTRKQQSDDKFDMISGTNGLLGAADGAFIMHKEKRTGNAAVLEISGRDQPDQNLHLIRNEDTLQWELDHADVDTHAPKPEPILEAVAKLITPEHPEWCGTATELLELLDTEIPVNAITKQLNVNAGRLLNEYGIHYVYSRTRDSRQIRLTLRP